MLAHAITHGATDIVLGIGGSASTDGGAGMVQALGARLLDEQGRDLPLGGGALQNLASLELTGLRQKLGDVRIVVASDVDNPLLGPRGAAAVFGPQKGASPADVSQLERALAVWAKRVAEATGTDLASRAGAGAAGGTGFAAMALLNAELRPGIELLLDWLDFDRALVGADLVITGEGSLDEQSLAGKAPVGVAQGGGASRSDHGSSGRPQPIERRAVAFRGHFPGLYGSPTSNPMSTRALPTLPPLHETGQRIASDWFSTRDERSHR